MKIRVVAANPLVRKIEAAQPDSKVVFEYVDRRSTSPLEALDAAWRICNAAHDHLTESEARLRDVWDACAGGLGLSVGDVVEVDGATFRCRPEGWIRA